MDNSDARTFDVFSLLKRLVETESPSHNKSAVDKVGEIVAEECRHLGAQIMVHSQTETGNHIEATFSRSQSINSRAKEPEAGGHSSQPNLGEKRILLLAHMDTVFPIGTSQKMPFHEQDGKVFGPGVSDMKGGIVVALAALAKVIEDRSLPHQVTALFTSDEEIGSGTSRPLIEKLASECDLVLVLEPGMTDGAVKTWRKGVGEFTVRVRGRAAHAGGDHAAGRNAIEEIANQVLTIQKMTDYKKGTTLNVGVIRGGIASNVVPDEANIEVDLRVMQPGEAERICTALQTLKPLLEGTTVEVSGGLNRPPMPENDAIKTTFERVKAIAAHINIGLKSSGTGGASDANFVAALGIPVLDGLGPAGGEYHSEREFIIKSSLLERIKLLTAILQDW
jgi:glutamate carboxypeptidase